MLSATKVKKGMRMRNHYECEKKSNSNELVRNSTNAKNVRMQNIMNAKNVLHPSCFLCFRTALEMSHLYEYKVMNINYAVLCLKEKSFLTNLLPLTK